MDEYDSDSSLSDDSDIEIMSTVGGVDKNERKALKKDNKIQLLIFASFSNTAERADVMRGNGTRSLKIKMHFIKKFKHIYVKDKMFKV